MFLVTKNFFGPSGSWKLVVNYVTCNKIFLSLALEREKVSACKGFFSIWENDGIKLNTKFPAMFIQGKICIR